MVKMSMSDARPPKKFELTPEQEKALALKAADLPGLLEYAHSVGGFSIVPTEAGEIRGHALQAMQEQTTTQMGMLYQQMQLLAQQAREIRDRVELSEKIYCAEMRFSPTIGQNYFLYKRPDGGLFLSMLSPQDWGAKLAPNVALAKATLLADHTWKLIEKFQELNF